MRELLNEKPFEHHCCNGTLFIAERCDFKGGLTALVPTHLTAEQMMEDAFQLGGWHWANIVPLLNGFTGPPVITIVRGTSNEVLSHQELLMTPIMEYFTLSSLKKLEYSPGTAIRAHNALKSEFNKRPGYERKFLYNTLGQFIQHHSLALLSRTPNLGTSSIALIVRRLDEDKLQLPLR